MMLLTLLFTSLFSHAATIAPLSNSEVLVVGPITSSSGENFAVQFNKVLFLLPEGKPLTIYLNSEGGSLDSAEDMIKVIKIAQQYGVQVHTLVPNTEKIAELLRQAIHYSQTEDHDSIVILPSELPQEGLCLSACTLIFAAGNQRIAAQDAIFLFHAPAPAEYLTTLATAQEINDERMAYAKMWLETIANASPLLARFLNEELHVLTDPSKEFAASADQIHKRFPDFIQKITE